MTQHTPGPWEIFVHDPDEPLGLDDIDILRAGDKPEFERTVCTVRVCRTEAEQLANAKLIEAAPEMLYALELAEKYLAHPDVQAAGTANFVLAAPVALSIVRNVIKRAKGVQP